MLALLVQKQRPRAATDLAGLPAAVPQGAREEWFGVYQGGRKIGHTRRVTTRTADGWRFQDEARLVLALMGSPHQLATTLVAETDSEWALRAFRFRLLSPAGGFTASGEHDAGRLRVRYGAGGRDESLLAPVSEPIHLAATMRPRIAAARPAPGTRFEGAVWSPLALRSERTVTVVEGVEVEAGEEALRLREESRGVHSRVWLAADGRTLREQASMGLELRAESRATAVAGLDGAVPADLVAATRIPLSGAIARPRERASLALRLRGAAAARVPDVPPRQRVRDGILTIVREPPPAPGGAAEGGVPARWLAASPFIESDHPDVLARAQAIVAGEDEPVARAGRLLAWVHAHVTPEPALTVPSALEVLRSRRGDCNEHAVLLAALARAAGIPARVIAGAVATEDGVLYHAWNELWLGRWVTADAVFAQMPADATHVRLVEGGPERHLELLEIVGQLEFATLDGDAS